MGRYSMKKYIYLSIIWRWAVLYIKKQDGGWIKIYEIFSGKSLKKDLSIDTTFDLCYFSWDSPFKEPDFLNWDEIKEKKSNSFFDWELQQKTWKLHLYTFLAFQAKNGGYYINFPNPFPIGRGSCHSKRYTVPAKDCSKRISRFFLCILPLNNTGNITEPPSYRNCFMSKTRCVLKPR